MIYLSGFIDDWLLNKTAEQMTNEACGMYQEPEYAVEHQQ